MKKKLGIIGGMGPLATVDLFHEVVDLTKAYTDQDHICVVIDNNTKIPDRTAAIMGQGPSSLPELKKSLHRLMDAGAEVIIIGCNTAHYYYEELLKETKNIKLLSITQETAKACVHEFGKKKGVLLSTRGTLQSGIYEKALQKEGVTYFVPDERHEDDLMRIIYDGVKKVGVTPDVIRQMNALLEDLVEEGAAYAILGCTELSMLRAHMTLPSVNSTEALVRAAIKLCGYQTVR